MIQIQKIQIIQMIQIQMRYRQIYVFVSDQWYQQPPAFCVFLNPTSSCRQPKRSQMLYCLHFTPILAARWSHHSRFGGGAQSHLGCTARRAHRIAGAKHAMTGPSTQELVYPQMRPFTFTCRFYPMLSPKAQQLNNFRAHRKQTDGQQEYDT